MQDEYPLTLPPQVDLRYIPRSANLEPRIRLTVFRASGCVMLDIRLSAIAKICRPASEDQGDALGAFRASVPALLRDLNTVIAEAPAGAVVFISDVDSSLRLAA